MCGINGFLTNNNNLIDHSVGLAKMNNSIIHRGPDSEGKYIERSNDYTLSMGMRRLSIIDLNNGNQPMFSADKTKVIVFNGEIYNYKSLRDDLKEKGCNFNTNSDTEVILKLYEIEGPECFGKLDGMFAFSIYDKKLNKVFIARDFFGEKPLYYSNLENSFIWASELKSILLNLTNKPQINQASLSLYLQLTFIPAPYTIYNGIQKLEANHYIELDCKCQSYSVFEIKKENIEYEFSTKKDAIKITRDLVQRSVLSRSISDVRIGTFLSGGVDSSIVSLCLAQQSISKIDTFSIGFKKRLFDETDKSREVSKLIQSNHHEFIISEKELSNNIDEILLNFDEPFADSSALATYLLSKNTKEYVKVALTGDGGDEVFGGYNKYYLAKLTHKYTSIIPSKLHYKSYYLLEQLLNLKDDSRGLRFKLKKFFKSINYNNDYYFNIISLGFTENEIKMLLNSDNIDNSSLEYFKDKLVTNGNNIYNYRAIDKVLSLEGDMLVKIDRTSMMNSLETRAPFLNKDLWDFTNKLPDSYLINGWDKKHILKEAFKSYFPNNFLNKSKKGFGVPVGDWLRNGLRSELISYVNKSLILTQNIFIYEVISKIVDDHINSKVDNTFQVWTFFCFQKWYFNTYKKL